MNNHYEDDRSCFFNLDGASFSIIGDYDLAMTYLATARAMLFQLDLVNVNDINHTAIKKSMEDGTYVECSQNDGKKFVTIIVPGEDYELIAEEKRIIEEEETSERIVPIIIAKDMSGFVACMSGTFKGPYVWFPNDDEHPEDVFYDEDAYGTNGVTPLEDRTLLSTRSDGKTLTFLKPPSRSPSYNDEEWYLISNYTCQEVFGDERWSTAWNNDPNCTADPNCYGDVASAWIINGMRSCIGSYQYNYTLEGYELPIPNYSLTPSQSGFKGRSPARFALYFYDEEEDQQQALEDKQAEMEAEAEPLGSPSFYMHFEIDTYDTEEEVYPSLLSDSDFSVRMMDTLSEGGCLVYDIRYKHWTKRVLNPLTPPNWFDITDMTTETNLSYDFGCYLMVDEVEHELFTWPESVEDDDIREYKHAHIDSLKYYDVESRPKVVSLCSLNRVTKIYDYPEIFYIYVGNRSEMLPDIVEFEQEETAGSWNSKHRISPVDGMPTGPEGADDEEPLFAGQIFLGLVKIPPVKTVTELPPETIDVE